MGMNRDGKYTLFVKQVRTDWFSDSWGINVFTNSYSSSNSSKAVCALTSLSESANVQKAEE